MARYSLGWQKTSITATGPIADIGGSTTDRWRLLECGLFVSAMSGTTPVLTVGLSRSTALGTRTTPTTVLAEDNADTTGTNSVATAWSVNSTLAANPFRRFVLNAIGAGVIWTWPGNGFMGATSLTAVLSALAIAGSTPNFTLDGYFVIDE